MQDSLFKQDPVCYEQNRLKRIQVALPVPLDVLFDYLCVDVLPAIGCRVRVPFQSRKLVGVVWSHNSNTDISDNKLKTVIEVIDQSSIFTQPQRIWLEQVARYYQQSLGEVVATSLPALMRKGEPAELEQEAYYQLCENFDIKLIPKRAKRQQQLAEHLLQHLPISSQKRVSASELKKLDISREIIKSGLSNHWLIQNQQTAIPGLLRGKGTDKAPTLNNEQNQVVTKVSEHLHDFCPFLLEGITGSGKTEVYLQLMQMVLRQKQQVLMLVPEIGLAPQTLKQIQTRLDVNIVLFHSAMTDRERSQAWLAARAGLVDVVIGTRSAVFTPLPQLGLILLDEEHDLSFKQQEGLRYHARDVALLRAQKLKIPIILGSATPSLETLNNAISKRFQWLKLTQRAGAAKPPKWELLDVRRLPLNQGLSKPLIERVGKHIGQGEQVLLFLNRRGYSPTLFCHDCGWMAECQRCDARYTLHRQPSGLICHHCDSRRSLPSHCPECQSAELHPLGVGTERLEETLQHFFKQTPIIRIDRDVARKKGVLQQRLDQIHSGESAILLGTQMLAKGHHFPNVTLVAIVDVDGMLFSSDFRAMERGAQLLVQVGGRAGRGERKGTVMLQTFHPDHPMLQLLLEQGYQALSMAILTERKQAQLPPFSFLALLRAESHNAVQVEQLLGELIQLFSGISQEVMILGPVPAVMKRKQGRYHYQLLLQSNKRSALHQVVSAIRLYLNSKNGRKLARNLRWSLDVDPQEMV